jgi:hypothetical protein
MHHLDVLLDLVAQDQLVSVGLGLGKDDGLARVASVDAD